MASSLVLLMTQAKAPDDQLPCHRENPQLWFSDLPADLQLAKAYCQPCPMRRVCLAGAAERHEPHGVWDGEIFARGAIITESPRGRPPRRVGRVKSLMVRVRSPAALRLATISARIASTAPSRPLGPPRARPDWAARAALTASSGSDLPCRRRSWRSERSTSTTRMPAAVMWRARPAP